MAKSQRQKAPKGRTSINADAITDPRFANIHTDPRFRLPSKKHTHVKLDQRFAHMLNDDDFSKKADVDRYGRVLPQESGRKELERFYRVETGDGNLQEEKPDLETDEEVDDDDAVRTELERVSRKHDPAREGGFSSSEESSSEDNESDGENETALFDVPETQIEHQQDVPMGEISSRLAVVNLDWDNIRAVDLMAVFSSFCPSAGRLQKVSIYPSEFGKERIEREELEGPPREIFTSNGDGADTVTDSDESASDADERIRKSLQAEDEGKEFDSTKLRRYQIERLRYFYAVLTFSSPATAKAIYDTVDGAEYLTTANFFDLRFVPDTVSFDDDRPHDDCSHLPEGYKPNDFVTNALQHSKVQLTWDADDRTRKDLVAKAFSGSRAAMEENALRAYLGSSSSGSAVSSEDDQAPEPATAAVTKTSKAARLRSALGLSSTPGPPTAKSSSARAPVGDMQITFTSGLSTTAPRASVFENSPERDETTVEKYVRKEKERKQRRKAKVKAQRDTTVDGEVDTDGSVESVDGGNKAADDDGAEKQDDLGFDDPFFADPSSKPSKPSKSKSKSKLPSTSKPITNHPSSPSTTTNTSTVDPDSHSHFSLPSILRAEKSAKKKSKHGSKKRTHSPTAADDLQPDFKLDVKDPRFAGRLFGDHEFAIDPSSARYRDTTAMRGLLEEGRKRRRVEGD
ncbi:MAG: pre-rRNA-processing protein esf1 [Piccolia ochrophora]|nr:MAG: pre-rRNA-processing protein esf1 [Piccolia ochrophora]